MAKRTGAVSSWNGPTMARSMRIRCGALDQRHGSADGLESTRAVDSWMLSWGSSVTDGIGILPAPGSGWADVIANGQRARLKRYVDAHVVAFGHARLLSWVPGEEEAEGRYRVGAAWAALRPLRQPEHFKNLRLLRALNLAATLPCLIAKL